MNNRITAFALTLCLAACTEGADPPDATQSTGNRAVDQCNALMAGFCEAADTCGWPWEESCLDMYGPACAVNETYVSETAFAMYRDQLAHFTCDPGAPGEGGRWIIWDNDDGAAVLQSMMLWQ